MWQDGFCSLVLPLQPMSTMQFFTLQLSLNTFPVPVGSNEGRVGDSNRHGYNANGKIEIRAQFPRLRAPSWGRPCFIPLCRRSREVNNCILKADGSLIRAHARLLIKWPATSADHSRLPKVTNRRYFTSCPALSRGQPASSIRSRHARLVPGPARSGQDFFLTRVHSEWPHE
jgi:hypothetical protein